MTNLNNISDEILLIETLKLVQREREILGLVLHHLREIERRRLFSTEGCSSLFDYATRKLGYSEDQAYRRIQAMRLLKEIPQIENKITDGSLSLTHLGMAQSLFKREEKSGQKTYTIEEKVKILEKLQNTSKREAEKITVSLSSSPVTSVEKIKTISPVDFEIRFCTKEPLLKKIQKLKALLAHKNPNIQLSELFNQLCDLGLEKWDKSQVQAGNAKIKTLKSPAPERAGKPLSEAGIAREVWKRDNGVCQNCKSSYALEIDHKIPRAVGGGNALENLRLLCRSCNQREAIKIFGLKKMDRYFNGGAGLMQDFSSEG